MTLTFAPGQFHAKLRETWNVILVHGVVHYYSMTQDIRQFPHSKATMYSRGLPPRRYPYIRRYPYMRRYPYIRRSKSLGATGELHS